MKLHPLPQTGIELGGIAKLFPCRNVEKRIGLDASEAWLKDADFARYRYVHFATHALSDDMYPERSALVLTPSDGEDGLLQVREIGQLSLRADIAVLSACDTGLGKLVRGEGFLGLTQAFFHAGARNVVASLWPVDDDSCATLMQAFYWNLCKHPGARARALRAAKIDSTASRRICGLTTFL